MEPVTVGSNENESPKITTATTANADHGWQKVSYAKRQCKAKPGTDPAAATPISARANSAVLNGEKNNVFRSLEQQAEERRRRILGPQQTNVAIVVAPRRSKHRSDDDSDAKNAGVENGKAEEVGKENECDEDDDWEYVEEGLAEIIWQGNEIIIRKKKVKVPKKDATLPSGKEDADRPTSNPLPPQSETFADFQSAQQALETVAREVPNFGTEQDKAHCPFHLKTGACRFGQSCSRVHFYPDKSCTLLIKSTMVLALLGNKMRGLRSVFRFMWFDIGGDLWCWP